MGQIGLVGVDVMLQPTVSRPVCLGVRHPSGTHDQIFITVTELRVYVQRGRVCSLQLLLGLASAVILESESAWVYHKFHCFRFEDPLPPFST
jgi:hypothetical protein